MTNATDVKLTEVEAVVAEHRGARGLVRLRRVLPLVDGGAESPQETRTRLVVIDAGLPRPETQIVVVDPIPHSAETALRAWVGVLNAISPQAGRHHRRFGDPLTLLSGHARQGDLQPERCRDVNRHAEVTGQQITLGLVERRLDEFARSSVSVARRSREPAQAGRR